jgi:hypothetical protein
VSVVANGACSTSGVACDVSAFLRFNIAAVDSDNSTSTVSPARDAYSNLERESGIRVSAEPIAAKTSDGIAA